MSFRQTTPFLGTYASPLLAANGNCGGSSRRFAFDQVRGTAFVYNGGSSMILCSFPEFKSESVENIVVTAIATRPGKHRAIVRHPMCD